MKRITTVVLSLILLSVAGLVGYEVYRRFESMDAKVEGLARKTDLATQVAATAAASSQAAKLHATEAAENAKAAGNARAQAEQLQKQAESGQAQARAEQGFAGHQQYVALRASDDADLGQHTRP